MPTWTGLFTRLARAQAECPDLLWTQTSPNTWKRGLDEIEEVYTNLLKVWQDVARTNFGITGHISLVIPVPVGLATQAQTSQAVDVALLKAWERIRFDHPNIATQVSFDEDVGRYMKTFTTTITRSAAAAGLEDDEGLNQGRDHLTIEDWLKQTFLIIPPEDSQTGESFTAAGAPCEDFVKLFVVCPRQQQNDPNNIGGEVRRDLVLRARPDMIDCIGMLTLLDNLVTRAAEIFTLVSLGGEAKAPIWGIEHTNLSPPFRIAAGVPRTLTQTQAQKLREIEADEATIRESGPGKPEIVGVPIKTASFSMGRHQRVALTLSNAETVKILAECKKIGWTITHAFHAAMAMAIRCRQPRLTIQSPPRTIRYISHVLQNERPSCMEPYCGSQHPAAVYHSRSATSIVVDMAVPSAAERMSTTEGALAARRAEFQQIALYMESFYRNISKDPDHVDLAPHRFHASQNPESTPSTSLLQVLEAMVVETMAADPMTAEAVTAEIAGPEIRPTTDDDHSAALLTEMKSVPAVTLSSMGVLERVVSRAHGAFKCHSPWVTMDELGKGLSVSLGTFRDRLCMSAAYNEAWHDRASVLRFLEECRETIHVGFGMTKHHYSVPLAH